MLNIRKLIRGAGLFLGVQVIDGPLKYGKIKFLDGIFIGDFDEEELQQGL